MEKIILSKKILRVAWFLFWLDVIPLFLWAFSDQGYISKRIAIGFPHLLPHILQVIGILIGIYLWLSTIKQIKEHDNIGNEK